MKNDVLYDRFERLLIRYKIRYKLCSTNLSDHALIIVHVFIIHSDDTAQKKNLMCLKKRI